MKSCKNKGRVVHVVEIFRRDDKRCIKTVVRKELLSRVRS